MYSCVSDTWLFQEIPEILPLLEGTLKSMYQQMGFLETNNLCLTYEAQLQYDGALKNIAHGNMISAYFASALLSNSEPQGPNLRKQDLTFRMKEMVLRAAGAVAAIRVERAIEGGNLTSAQHVMFVERDFACAEKLFLGILADNTNQAEVLTALQQLSALYLSAGDPVRACHYIRRVLLSSPRSSSALVVYADSLRCHSRSHMLPLTNSTLVPPLNFGRRGFAMMCVQL